MWRASLLLMAASACASTAHTASTSPSEAHGRILGTGPWIVGRAALYQSERGGRFERLTVVSTDACGTWVEAVSLDVGRDRRVRLCIQPATGSDPLSILREVRTQSPDGHWDVFAITDREATTRLVGSIVARLVSLDLAHALDVPAYTLLGHTDGERVVAAPSPRRPSGLYFALAGGGGWLGGSDAHSIAVAGAATSTVVGDWGYRVATHVDVVSTFTHSTADYSPDRFREQSLFGWQLGARLRPFDTRGEIVSSSGLAGVYVQLTTGVSLLGHTTDDGMQGVARGWSTTSALGVTLFGGRDWGCALEVRETLTLFNRDQGMRDQFDGLVKVQLRLP